MFFQVGEGQFMKPDTIRNIGGTLILYGALGFIASGATLGAGLAFVRASYSDTKYNESKGFRKDDWDISIPSLEGIVFSAMVFSSGVYVVSKMGESPEENKKRERRLRQNTFWYNKRGRFDNQIKSIRGTWWTFEQARKLGVKNGLPDSYVSEMLAEKRKVEAWGAPILKRLLRRYEIAEKKCLKYRNSYG